MDWFISYKQKQKRQSGAGACQRGGLWYATGHTKNNVPKRNLHDGTTDQYPAQTASAHPLPLRLAIWVVLLAAVAALVGAGLHASGVIGSHSSKTTRLGFEDIGEMATQAAYTTQVNVTEGSRVLWGVTIPFTQSKYIYSYDVTIKAGIDFGGIDWDLDEEQKTIRVTMPETRVLSSEINLDSFKHRSLTPPPGNCVGKGGGQVKRRLELEKKGS